MASMMEEEIGDEDNEEKAAIYPENPTEMKERKEGRFEIMKDILENVELTISEIKELKGVIVSKHRLCLWESERIKQETQGSHGRNESPQLTHVALEKIFSSLSTRDVLSSRLVCQNWREAATMELRKRTRQELYFNTVEREEIKEYLEVMKKSQLLPITSFALNMEEIQDKDFHIMTGFFQIFGPVMESLSVDFRRCTADPTSFETPLKMYLDGIQFEKLKNLLIILRENDVPSSAMETRTSLITAYFRSAINLEKLTLDSVNSSGLLRSLENEPAFSYLRILFLDTGILRDEDLEILGRGVKLKRLSLTFYDIDFKSETMKSFLQSQSETLEYLKLCPLLHYEPTEFMYEFPRMKNLKILSIEKVKETNKNECLLFGRMDWNESFPKLNELKMRGGFVKHWMELLFLSDTSSASPHHGLKRLDFPIGIRCCGYGFSTMKLSLVNRIFPNIETIKFSIQDLFYVFRCWEFNWTESDPFLSSTFLNLKRIVLRCDEDFFTDLKQLGQLGLETTRATRIGWNEYEYEDEDASQEFQVQNYLKEFAWGVILNRGLKRSCEHLTSVAFEIYSVESSWDEMGPRIVRKTFDCTWFLGLLRERIKLQELFFGIGGGGGGSEIGSSSHNFKKEHDWMNAGNIAEEKAVIAEEFRFRRNPIEKKQREKNEWRFKIMKRIIENIPLEISEMNEFMNILMEKQRACEREIEWTKQMETQCGELDLSSLPDDVLEKIFTCSSLSTNDILSSRLVCRHWRTLATMELRKHTYKHFSSPIYLNYSKDVSRLKEFLEVMQESHLLPVTSFHIKWEYIQGIKNSEEMNFFEIFSPTLTHLRLDFEDIDSNEVSTYLEGIQLENLDELKLYFGQNDNINSDVRTSVTTTCFVSAQNLRRLKSDISMVVLLRSLENSSLPNLRTLSLTVYRLVDKDLEDLGFVLKLKRLSLTIHDIGFKAETMKRFLESQRKTLEYLKLIFSDRGNTEFVFEYPRMERLTGFYFQIGTRNLRYPRIDWNKCFPKLQELIIYHGHEQVQTELLFPLGTKSRHFALQIIDLTVSQGIGRSLSDSLPVIGRMFPNVHTLKICSDDFLDPVLLDTFPNLKQIILRPSFFEAKREKTKNRLKKFVRELNLNSHRLPSVKDYITRLIECAVQIKENVTREDRRTRETYDCTWLLSLLLERIKLEDLDEELKGEAEVEMKKRFAEVNLDSSDEEEMIMINH